MSGKNVKRSSVSQTPPPGEEFKKPNSPKHKDIGYLQEHGKAANAHTEGAGNKCILGISYKKNASEDSQNYILLKLLRLEFMNSIIASALLNKDKNLQL